MLRRQQRKIAIALLMLNVSGARAVAVTDSCQRCRTFYSSSLSFKAIAKAVTRQEWRQPAPHSFGERHIHFSTKDLEAMGRRLRVALVLATPPTSIALETQSARAGPAGVWALPTDLHPVQPPHRLI